MPPFLLQKAAASMPILRKISVILFLFIAFLAPLVWFPGLSDFSNLPQRIFLETLGILLCFSWLTTQATDNGLPFHRFPFFTWPLLGFLGWAMFTGVYALNPYEAWEIGRQWLVALLFFLLASQLMISSARRRQVLIALFTAAF
ncbi:MAG: hypothetical protein L6364_10865, partial [Desulfobulbaceae bacterium]|nr:hypothetical protein [Desulfobulbaceae bacterium]